MNQIGYTFRQLREEKGWTVARLERKSNVSRHVIYKLENEGRGQIETYEKLLRAMGYKITIEPEPIWGFDK